MSDRYGGFRQCTGKRKYRSEQQADAEARKATQREQWPCHSYQCNVCGRWHIGKDKRHAV